LRKALTVRAPRSVHVNDPIVGSPACETGARARTADDVPETFIAFELGDASGNGNALVRGRLERRAHAFRDGSRDVA
jgi:hypothetical protein